MKNKNNVLKDLMPKMVKKYKSKYESYMSYLPKNFFEERYKEFISLYDFESGTNFEVCYDLFIQCKINQELIKLIKNGNVDLEIELIDKYMPTLNLIIKKMKIELSVMEKENILIKALETYDGTRLLSLHMVKIVHEVIGEKNSVSTNNEKVYFKKKID